MRRSRGDGRPSSTRPTRYSAFANVTSVVAAAGAGTYSVANVQAGTGGDRYAGWTLVVAYEDLDAATAQPHRRRRFRHDRRLDAQPTTIPIGGFRTPPTGPVRTTLGFVAYEGDSGLTGDSASLNGTTLSDAASPPNNFFDSRRSRTSGSNVTTRNPNDVNNWAYDSKLVNANGILPNNATNANIVVTTSGDTYFPGRRDARDRPVRAEHHELEVGRQPHAPRRSRSARRRAALHGVLHEHRCGPGRELRDARFDPGGDDLRAGEPARSPPVRRRRRARRTRSATTRPSSTPRPGR